MLSYKQWPWKSFPPYLQGSSYLISGTAITSLVAAAQVTPFCQPNGSIEDIYVTGILTEVANVTVRSVRDRFVKMLNHKSIILISLIVLHLFYVRAYILDFLPLTYNKIT